MRRRATWVLALPGVLTYTIARVVQSYMLPRERQCKSEREVGRKKLGRQREETRLIREVSHQK